MAHNFRVRQYFGGSIEVVKRRCRDPDRSHHDAISERHELDQIDALVGIGCPESHHEALQWIRRMKPRLFLRVSLEAFLPDELEDLLSPA